jgi:uncharacterized coiled-coil DUF342 family protein
MASGEIFDPHALLMKLRNPHNGQQTKGNSQGFYDRRIPPPFPDQMPVSAEERPEVIHEMEAEIKELAAEVSKLRTVNRQLTSEKRTLEAQLMEQKEKSDDVVAKLRSFPPSSLPLRLSLTLSQTTSYLSTSS